LADRDEAQRHFGQQLPLRNPLTWAARIFQDWQNLAEAI
jgi:hypothetical protein